jgi:hypothetical protein
VITAENFLTITGSTPSPVGAFVEMLCRLGGKKPSLLALHRNSQGNSQVWKKGKRLRRLESGSLRDG